eukprot:TRINITY_DN19756_c0_g1_i1.p2 TRINITY_DN19756_c0_g1~~TRINITY_DN19756_c0_g1_i1.p2  ORF type:complete len:129 (+),score=47.18 TRINITY_DN19756_c0_g1_i1:55-387(+)
MAEAAQRGLQTAVEELMDKFDRQRMRPMQKKVFLCMADCVSDASVSHERTVVCQQNCGLPIQRVQQVVEHEIHSLQERMQRGVMGCQDEGRAMRASSSRRSRRWTSVWSA